MIRLGVILASPTISSWQARALAEVCDRGVAQVAVVATHPENHRYANAEQQKGRKGVGTLYAALDWLIAKHRHANDESCAPVDARTVLNKADWLPRGEACDRIDESIIKRCVSHQLDAIIQFGCEHLHEEAIAASRYGVWLCRHRGTSGDSSFLEAISDGDTLIESEILAVTLQGPQTVWRSWTSVAPNSIRLTQARVYWKTSDALARQLARLDGGSFASCPSGVEGKPREDSRNGSSGSLTLRLARQTAMSVLRKMAGRDGWVVGVRERRCHRLDDYCTPDLGGFVPVPIPEGRFLADPFVFERAGEHFIFCEDFRRSAGKGVISCIAIRDGFRFSEPQVVLERPFHLSYPFLIQDGGELFMIPEAAAGGNVELYRCVRFPDRWELESVLLDGFAGLDNTLLCEGGRYWIFTSPLEPLGDTVDDLHVFRADSLRGPFHPLPSNPVFSDVRRARAAGNFIRVGGLLIRPSQDCSKRYGWRINFNRVLALSKDCYQEEVLGRARGEWMPGLEGTHTWNADSKYEVIDGPLWLPRWRQLPSRQAVEGI